MDTGVPVYQKAQQLGDVLDKSNSVRTSQESMVLNRKSTVREVE